MLIRKAEMKDLEDVWRIYVDARQFMGDNGNPDQWGDMHPRRELIVEDIQAGLSYVCVSDGVIVAVFYFNIEVEPTYGKIDGQWLSEGPYGVVHRIARAGGVGAHGAGAFCLDWCFEQCFDLRIDTHRDNASMRGLLNRLGFVYCGIIWIENGDERLAFQKVR